MRQRGGHAFDLNQTPRDRIDAAARKVNYPSEPVGKVIAELTFGFWRNLTTAAHEKALWVPYLHHAFPAGTDSRRTDQALRHLNELRNRVAHMEPIFTRNLAADAHSIIGLCRALHPQVGDFVQATSGVPALLRGLASTEGT